MLIVLEVLFSAPRELASREVFQDVQCCSVPGRLGSVRLVEAARKGCRVWFLHPFLMTRMAWSGVC